MFNELGPEEVRAIIDKTPRRKKELPKTLKPLVSEAQPLARKPHESDAIEIELVPMDEEIEHDASGLIIESQDDPNAPSRQNTRENIHDGYREVDLGVGRKTERASETTPGEEAAEWFFLTDSPAKRLSEHDPVLRTIFAKSINDVTRLFMQTRHAGSVAGLLDNDTWRDELMRAYQDAFSKVLLRRQADLDAQERRDYEQRLASRQNPLKH